MGAKNTTAKNYAVIDSDEAYGFRSVSSWFFIIPATWAATVGLRREPPSRFTFGFELGAMAMGTVVMFFNYFAFPSYKKIETPVLLSETEK